MPDADGRASRRRSSPKRAKRSAGGEEAARFLGRRRQEGLGRGAGRAAPRAAQVRAAAPRLRRRENPQCHRGARRGDARGAGRQRHGRAGGRLVAQERPGLPPGLRRSLVARRLEGAGREGSGRGRPPDAAAPGGGGAAGRGHAPRRGRHRRRPGAGREGVGGGAARRERQARRQASRMVRHAAGRAAHLGRPEALPVRQGRRRPTASPPSTRPPSWKSPSMPCASRTPRRWPNAPARDPHGTEAARSGQRSAAAAPARVSPGPANPPGRPRAGCRSPGQRTLPQKRRRVDRRRRRAHPA